MTGTPHDGANSGNRYVEIAYDDLWAPLSTPVVTPVLPASAQRWYRSEVTVKWNWTDRGVIDSARCAPTTVFTPPDGQIGHKELINTFRTGFYWPRCVDPCWEEDPNA